MEQQFTEKARRVLRNALHDAQQSGRSHITTESLLLGMLMEKDCVAGKILTARGLDEARLRKEIAAHHPPSQGTRTTSDEMSPRLKRVIAAAGDEATRNGRHSVGTEYLLLALLSERDSLSYTAIEGCGLSASDVKGDVIEFIAASPAEKDEKPTQSAKKGASGEAKSKDLLRFGRDLTAAARNGLIDPIIGRENESDRVIRTLVRRRKNNPCLVGEPGVGKTAVVEGIALRIAEGRVPAELQNKTILSLDLSSMIAGAKYRGEFEERMKAMLETLIERPDVILFIDEIHMLIGAGAAEGAVDAANMLKPALARGEIRLIGATTLAEYRSKIERDGALERRFQAILVSEPSENETLSLLLGLRATYEAHHHVKITDAALRAAVSLSERFLPDRRLPDKAIDLIDEAAAKARLADEAIPAEIAEMKRRCDDLMRRREAAITGQRFSEAAALRDEEKAERERYRAALQSHNDTRSENPTVIDEESIAVLIEEQTGVPVSRLIEGEESALLTLEDALKSRVIGQEEAVTAVAEAIRRGRIGLKQKHRPIGSFLFLGPSGVGKTELAKAIAETVFGQKSAFIRLDMSEYAEKHSIARLIGSPPGYVGYGEGGQLTERVRRNPYSVILLDEIEKAHPEFFHLLLQVLEDGVLTDSMGKQVDFSNTVLIMTSNLGASDVTESRTFGFTSSASAQDSELRFVQAAERALRRQYPPEFLNRIDETIVFRRLTAEHLSQIARKMLDELAQRLSSLGITAEFSEACASAIASAGRDPQYGARPLRRAITKEIEDNIAEALLSGKVKKGDRIRIDAENEEFTVKTV